MTLVDTGPLVGLTDPRDVAHRESRSRLSKITARLVTTLPVLTEAFHLLGSGSTEADHLRAFIMHGGAAVHRPTDEEVERAFELMETYRDQPMDLADASLVAAAETLGTRKVFTLDARDFGVYRVRRGHRHYAVEIV